MLPAVVFLFALLVAPLANQAREGNALSLVTGGLLAITIAAMSAMIATGLDGVSNARQAGSAAEILSTALPTPIPTPPPSFTDNYGDIDYVQHTYAAHRVGDATGAYYTPTTENGYEGIDWQVDSSEFPSKRALGASVAALALVTMAVACVRARAYRAAKGRAEPAADVVAPAAPAAAPSAPAPTDVVAPAATAAPAAPVALPSAAPAAGPPTTVIAAPAAAIASPAPAPAAPTPAPAPAAAPALLAPAAPAAPAALAALAALAPAEADAAVASDDSIQSRQQQLQPDLEIGISGMAAGVPADQVEAIFKHQYRLCMAIVSAEVVCVCIEAFNGKVQERECAEVTKEIFKIPHIALAAGHMKLFGKHAAIVQLAHARTAETSFLCLPSPDSVRAKAQPGTRIGSGFSVSFGALAQAMAAVGIHGYQLMSTEAVSPAASSNATRADTPIIELDTPHYALPTGACTGGCARERCSGCDLSRDLVKRRTPPQTSTVVRDHRQDNGIHTPPASPVSASASLTPATRRDIPHYALPTAARAGGCAKPGCYGHKLVSTPRKRRLSLPTATASVNPPFNSGIRKQPAQLATKRVSSPLVAKEAAPRYARPTGASTGLGCTRSGCAGHK